MKVLWGAETELTEADMRRRLQAAGKVHYVCWALRPGALMFNAALEHLYFDPRDKAKNAEYQLGHMQWQGLPWLVVSVPADRHRTVVDLATQMGMRVADGVPIVVEGGAHHLFPGAVLPNSFYNRAVWSIENDKGSPVYRSSGRDHKEIMRRELELFHCLAGGDRPDPRAMADFVFGPGELPRSK